MSDSILQPPTHPAAASATETSTGPTGLPDRGRSGEYGFDKIGAPVKPHTAPGC